MNNLKSIRHAFGATQDEVAYAIGVTRVTIAKWEGEFSRPTAGNLKKMAIFYGIDTDYFYERPVDARIKLLLAGNGEKLRATQRADAAKQREIDELAVLMAPVTFADASAQYQLSLKLLTARAEEATLGELRTMVALHRKMGSVLHTMLEQREAEAVVAAEDKGMPLFDLLEDT